MDEAVKLSGNAEATRKIYRISSHPFSLNSKITHRDIFDRIRIPHKQEMKRINLPPIQPLIPSHSTCISVTLSTRTRLKLINHLAHIALILILVILLHFGEPVPSRARTWAVQSGSHSPGDAWWFPSARCADLDSGDHCPPKNLRLTRWTEEESSMHSR